MNRIFLLFILSIPLMLNAQNGEWQIYPFAGAGVGFAIPLPLSDIPKGAKINPKLNPSLGVGLEYSLSGKWNIAFETGYHMLAFSAKADVRSQPFYFDNHVDVLYFSGKTSTNVRLQYLDFKLLAVYSIGSKWSFMPGVFYSRILKESFKTKGSDGILSPDKEITDNSQLPGPATASYNFNDFIDTWDAGILLGLRYKLKSRLYLRSSLQIGFKSIFVKEFENIEYEMYQAGLNLSVTYHFPIMNNK